MDKNNYKVPKNKKQLIEYINEAGIKDIICTSTNFDGVAAFGIEIHTNDGKCFAINQDIEVGIKFKDISILDFSTGNGYDVPVNLGSLFNPKKYKYNDFDWSLGGLDE